MSTSPEPEKWHFHPAVARRDDDVDDRRTEGHPMREGDLSWLELPGGRDCAVTGKFYAVAFGWSVDDDGATVWFRDPSGTLRGAFRGDLAAPPTGGPLPYLATVDMDAALAAVRDAGGEVDPDGTLVLPGVGRRALFRDPAGTTMGLFERAGSGEGTGDGEDGS